MASAEKVSALDTRVAALEEKLALPNSGGMPDSKSQNKAVETLTQRVARLETAFSLKFDSMLDRLAGLEKRMAEMAATPVSSAGSQKNTAVESTRKETKNAAVPMKKAVKKSNLFHTVKKGETLYSISRQYDTTVDRLRELNNLSQKADIYPGNNILVR